MKKNIKELKQNNVKFLMQKKITHDYFSSHAYNFYNLFSNYKINNVLEIGSFEGNSSMFFARYLKKSKIYCIDNWVGTEEYNNLNFNNIEKNFDYNIKEFKNIIKLKSSSDSFFKKNKIKFDLIYIDGYHKAEQVIKDLNNSWNFLNVNGILIFDDYIWKFYEKIEDNPCYAINIYLEKIKNHIKILKVSNSQLYIKKIK